MKATIQQTMPSLAFPSYDPHASNPQLREAELWVRQGFSWIQSFIANAALRVITENSKAQIVQSVVPMQKDKEIKDDFEMVMKGIYSYISVIIFMLPMYNFILRMQIEKSSGL